MNNGYCYAMKREPAQLNGPLDKLKSAAKKVTNTVKNVAQDVAKTAVNTVTTPIRTVTGKEQIYQAGDFNTKLFATGSQIQKATSAAGAGVIATVVPVQLLSKSGGGNTTPDPNPLPPQNIPPDDTLQASAGNLSPGKIAAGVGIVLALGTLIYFTTENN